MYRLMTCNILVDKPGSDHHFPVIGDFEIGRGLIV